MKSLWLSLMLALCALSAQAAELMHVSNLYFHPLQGEVAERLTRLSGLRRRAGIGREHTALSREDVQRALSRDARDAGG